MKKYSDYFSCFKGVASKVSSRVATTALFMVAAVTMGFAQEPYTFIEGSVHRFSVQDNPANTFEWGMYVDPYSNIMMPANSYDLMDGGTNSNLTIRFNDMDRVDAELVYLVVKESSPNGCSTRRALQIRLEPNNMYLEFASAISQECFTPDDYYAPLKVGLNFKDKQAGVPIPATYFPLQLSYTVRNLTAGTDAVSGNGGAPMNIEYSSTNNYSLLVAEAVGQPNETTEYELTITSVKDKYDTDITNNTGDIRIQIRIINHLPQSGTMDMAMAYVITGIEYLGVN